MVRLTSAITLMVCLAAVPAIAADQPVPTTDAALTGQAHKLHTEGVGYFRVSRYEEAYAAFAAAWAIKPRFQIAGPLGACELKLKKYRDAAEHLRYFVDRAPEGEYVEDLKSTRKLLVEASAKVVQLTVEVIPADAILRVNGKSVTAGDAAFYEPGEVTLDAVREGYTAAMQTQVLKPGTTRTIKLKLSKPQPALVPRPPPDNGLDGRLTAGLVLGGAAVVGLGIGMGGDVQAGGYADDIAALRNGAAGVEDVCTAPLSITQCPELARAIEDNDAAVSLAIGGYVVGTVLATASVGLIMWWVLDDDDEGKADDRPAVVMVPTFSDDGVGMTLIGAW